MAQIGDLCEIRGELQFEWKIKDFFSLSDEKDIYYVSPKFYFSGTSWELWIYPNGETQHQTEGYIALYVKKIPFGCPISLECSIGLKTLDGKTDPDKNFTWVFGEERSYGYGFRNFISRSVLTEKKSELMPSDELTVTCTLKNSKLDVVTGSLFHRLQEVSDNMKEIYQKSKNTDCKLNFKEGNISAHRMILQTRSPVFAAMFSHDTKENQTGEIPIKDIDKNTMDAVLLYMYSGDFPQLTTKNALSIYTAADKYDIKHVKELCVEFIIRNLSVEWVCDVIQFAELFQDEEINRSVREYLKRNAGEVLESENWKNLEKKNHELCLELLRTLVKEYLPK